MKFFVTGTKTEWIEKEFFADDPHGAAKKFRDTHSGFKVDDVTEVFEEGVGDSWNSLGQCAGCGDELFDGDVYKADEEGHRFCFRCG